ncbi:tubulin-specific chaperone D [Centruroides vittatus]|uniref:tubulin-specific chaperone D n=1 Tax=Centruroides vittatus TaxID=120091 RepID=UPI0035101F5E
MAESKEDVDNKIGLGCALEKFEEYVEINEIIEKLPEIYKDAITSELSYERFVYILDLYQEQPQLLYPYLDQLLSKLLSYSKNDSCDELKHLAFKLLYVIVKVGHHKTLVKYFPHEVADVEPVLELLAQQNPSDFNTWETRYILLLWLSVIVLIPFHMERFDSGMEIDGIRYKPISLRIMEVIKQYLSVGDKARDAAALLASRFLTRPDMKKEYLPEFLDWEIKMLKEINSETTAAAENLQIGILATLALLFKLGKREDMKQYGASVLKSILECNFQNSKNALVQKLMLKLIQRIGLSFMQSKLAAWRYSRGSRSLTANLISPNKPDNTGMFNHTTEDKLEEEEDYDIPGEIEDIIEQLLAGLRAKQTIVRWSSAKGIGRITSRLPWELAEDVISSVLELFCLGESDTAWHGGCLALAELGRRGLIIPSLLEKVIPVILKALVYDELLGNYSVGAHIRDAACYVCWSFARAFEPVILKPYVKDIATALVVTSIFDREINCRRAASAAFQENVGRQGTVPHGIDILTTADYFSVGSRPNAFLNISVYIAQFEEYAQPLIDHLLMHKVNHWDQTLRELSSKSLHNLTPRAPEYTITNVLPKLLTLSLSMDLNTRHGAILSVAEVIHALYKLAKEQGKTLEDFGIEDCVQKIRNIIFILKDRNLFRGLGGILMRQAVCILIEKASISALPFHSDTELLDNWQELIDNCLSQVDGDVRKTAVSAVPHFCLQYYVNEEEATLLLDNYLQKLHTGSEESRCGHICAIGSLPKHVLIGKVNNVVDSLIRCTKLPEREETLVEVKRDALKALDSVCHTIGIEMPGSGDSILNRNHLQTIYDCLVEALNDYTLDSRGDVGTIVRESAMVAIQDITQLIVARDPLSLTENLISSIFCGILKQCVEKIDRTRAIAGKTFSTLLHSEPEIPYVPYRKELEEIFPKSLCEEINWSSPADTFPCFVQLLSFEKYTYNLLLGLTVSVGGLTESLVKHSYSSLANYLNGIKSDSTHLKYICDTLVQILSNNLQNERIIVSYFRMTDLLLTSGTLISSEEESATFLTDILDLCWKACSKSTDPQKLIASVDVFCDLLQFKCISQRSLSYLTIFLCHRFPRVRKVTAGKIYEALLSYENVVPESSLDEAMNILSDTNWDDSVNTLRPIRNNFCELCGISPPKIVKKT